MAMTMQRNFTKEVIGEKYIDAEGKVRYLPGESGNGFIYKNYKAFREKDPEEVCYIPEFSFEMEGDELYFLTFTYKDILEACFDQEDIAEVVFDNLTWEYPSSLVEQDVLNGTLEQCPNCDTWYYTEWFYPNASEECPHCYK